MREVRWENFYRKIKYVYKFLSQKQCCGQNENEVEEEEVNELQ